MKSMQERLDGKVWKAVKAMVKGLENAQKNEDKFRVDMSTFGESNGVFCIGCAATCAVIELSPKGWDKLVPYAVSDDERRASFSGTTENDIEYFESVIDMLRKGEAGNLYRYLKGTDAPTWIEEIPLPYLDTIDYKDNLHVYKAFAKLLKSMDI